jgi:transcription antitermination factor NusG
MRGYEIFLPCYQERRRWSDRVRVNVRALFAGYVFCRVSTDAVGKIVTTPGVIRIVGDGTRAIAVPADEIEAVRRIVDAGLPSEPWPFPLAGQRVRIDIGPLSGTEGVVVRVKNRTRLVVSISLLQRSVAVELDADWVSIPPEELVNFSAHASS